jgi:hypothetical protein
MAAQHVLQLPPPPVIQTLAWFGGSAEVKGSAADALGNVYLLVDTGRKVIVKHSSKDNSLTELPLSSHPQFTINDLAASPDGEELYLYVHETEQVAVYRQPWGDPVDHIMLEDPAIGIGISCYKRG